MLFPIAENPQTIDKNPFLHPLPFRKNISVFPSIRGKSVLPPPQISSSHFPKKIAQGSKANTSEKAVLLVSSDRIAPKVTEWYLALKATYAASTYHQLRMFSFF